MMPWLCRIYFRRRHWQKWRRKESNDSNPGTANAFMLGGMGCGIAVSFGVLLGVSEDYRALIILIFYYLLFSALRVAPHRRRSIITYLCFTITSCILIVDKYIIYGCMGIAVIVIWKHKKAEMAQVRER